MRPFLPTTLYERMIAPKHHNRASDCHDQAPDVEARYAFHAVAKLSTFAMMTFMDRERAKSITALYCQRIARRRKSKPDRPRSGTRSHAGRRPCGVSFSTKPGRSCDNCAVNSCSDKPVLHPHCLRHSCGYALADKGIDLRTFQEWLGHRSIEMTVRYTSVCRQSISDSWLGNLRECLAHLV